MNDSELVQRLGAQDPDAVRHLTDNYLPSVWRFVFYRVNGDRHLAEDIVSESVLALIKAATTDVAIESPQAWLRTVASHKILDHYRAASRVQRLMKNVQQTADVVDNDDAVALQEVKERREEVRQVMDDMPEEHRMALEWKYIDKLSVRQIAERLDVTEKAAESILFRARRGFRDKLERTTAADDEPESAQNGVAPQSTKHVDVKAEPDVTPEPMDAAQPAER